MNDVENCSVCGRTILGGEQTRTYLTPEREPRTVCDLCRDRAERVGWVWEELAADLPQDGGRRRPGLASLLRGRVGRRRAEPAEEAAYPESPEPAADLESPEPDPNDDVEGADGEDTVPAEEPEIASTAEAESMPVPEPPAPRRSPDPAAPGAGIGRRLSPADSRMARIENAIERFNHSEESAMSAGLAKTLGPPWVSVGAAAGSSSEVRITVAWELSWYQWGVDISDELRPVYEIGKGGELTELDAPAKQWNARMEDSGQIELGPVSVGRQAGGDAGT